MSDSTVAGINSLVGEIDLGSARGGRRVAKPFQLDVVRELGPEDLPLLLNPPPVGSSPIGILEIRHSHHLLARTLAEGKSQEEAALITGYNPSYISILKDDPAFADLLAYYATQREEIFVDTVSRMKILGLNTLEELQRRIETEADQWTKRELMELVDLMLVKGTTSGGKGGGTAGAGGGGVSISVKFVGSAAGQPASGMIDVTPSQEKT